ncbi:hypothetical protein ACH5A3_42705 [Streptomyces echinatus]|uniref:hypothetical protein n=1 Tax=Streptomyces echinatus TaxID=67293 RepID=UPI0037A119B2
MPARFSPATVAAALIATPRPTTLMHAVAAAHPLFIDMAPIITSDGPAATSSHLHR